jgi:hypothetical protein
MQSTTVHANNAVAAGVGVHGVRNTGTGCSIAATMLGPQNPYGDVAEWQGTLAPVVGRPAVRTLAPIGYVSGNWVLALTLDNGAGLGVGGVDDAGVGGVGGVDGAESRGTPTRKSHDITSSHDDSASSTSIGSRKSNRTST